MSSRNGNGNRGYSISSKSSANNQSILKFLSPVNQPVKKPEEITTQQKISVTERLKSKNLKPLSAPFSPSNYKSPTGPFNLHQSPSTDSLSDNFNSLKMNKKPLRDLTTPNDSHSDSDQDSVIETSRVLRKRNRRPAAAVVISDSEEEIINHKRPKRVISDLEDESEEEEEEHSEVSDAEDEVYIDQDEKLQKEIDAMISQQDIDRIKQVYPSKTTQEIREAIYKTGEASKALNYFFREASGDLKLSKKRGFIDEDESKKRYLDKTSQNRAVLRFFNTSSSKDIQDITGCKPKIADFIIEELRPFDDIEDLMDKLKSNKGTSVNFVKFYEEMTDGYTAVDQIIERIEELGSTLKTTLDIWQGLNSRNNSAKGTPAVSDDDEPDEKAGTHLMELDLDPTMDTSSEEYKDALDGYIFEQPKYVNKGMTLKDYQLLGVNWMLLLYRKNISGILADEMGLGKTAQVISFLGQLYELGESGPHLIIVPSSTIENWLRELERFCPKLTVRLYHGSVKEREEQRYDLMEDRGEYQVVVTTYNIATSSDDDRYFLKKLKCRTMILDEGHMVKNCTSQRYKNLMKIRVPFRLLLTGTPLQNNLQELVSLLVFIMPETFSEFEEEVRTIFKIRVGGLQKEEEGQEASKKGTETAVQVLSRDRILRAKRMMTPFVLRRKKQDVLKDLPGKTQIVKVCPMTPNQRKLYTDIVVKSKKSLQDKEVEKAKKSAMSAQFEKMSNIIIHLRKAADHPLLFRNIYGDDLCRIMAKEIMRDVKYWDANEEYIYEDMCVMSDFELNNLCKENKHISKHQLKNNEWMDSGKIDQLKIVLAECEAKNEKVLIFSQFTRMLDILEMVMNTLDVSFVRLDGDTKVMERQNVIDDFNEDESIKVFLLSTKAGGFGINLTSANVVVLYDLDFNPQNDKQAEDRAHRVGQTKDVRIIKLISENSVEEYILKTADIKLRLDNRISSNEEIEDDDDSEFQQQSLQNMIREAIIKSDHRDDK